MKRKNRAGETIVEVLAGAVIFLLLMAILQGAVAFSGRAQRKSQNLREDFSAMSRKLEETPTAANPEEGSAVYEFYAYDTDEKVQGNQVFAITAGLGQKDVSYEDSEGRTKTVRFYAFR